MYAAIKTPSFFKPSSRPSSPAPAPAIQPNKLDMTPAFERSRPLSKLSLSGFRRASPSPAPNNLPPVTLVQDGSYLEVLGLKLSEAVSKALAQPAGPAAAHEQLGGRRPLPSGRGRALGAFIMAEIHATQDNPHLKRAIIRTLQRPLSVLLSNISAYLLPLLSSPAFLTTTLSPQTPNLNPTQLHAVGFATLAGEVLETFDELGLGLDNDLRPNGLKVTREGLVSLVKRVVNPLVSGIQNEIIPIIDRLEDANPLGRTASGLNAKPAKAAPIYHPSIISLQTVMPLYAKALSKITATRTAQSNLATTVIALVWHGGMALAHRPLPSPTPPSTPPQPAAVIVKAKSKSSNTTTPPTSPPSARFSMKLPPSRPNTPPNGQTSFTHAGDARALYELLNLLPHPSKENAATKLACEAVDEAFEGLASLVALLELIQLKGRATADVNLDELQNELEQVTEDLPTLIGLPVMLRTYVNNSQDGESRSVASMLGMSEADYRKTCLSGFNRADDCEEVVGQRVIDVLRGERGSPGALMTARWLERQIRDDN